MFNCIVGQWECLTALWDNGNVELHCGTKGMFNCIVGQWEC